MMILNKIKTFFVLFLLFSSVFVGSIFATFNYSQSNPNHLENNISSALEEFKYSCVAKGTLITLADGSQKPVEELTSDDSILVWNLFTGSFDVAPLLFLEPDPVANYEIIQLTFSDGTTIKIIDEHAFWDFNLQKYVFFRDKNEDYIGHWFKKQNIDNDGNITWSKVQLISIDIYTEITSAWGPVTYKHLCLYVNGLLSMPGATEGLINIFDVDVDTLKYDETKMQQDIEKYGLCSYEEFNSLVEIPEEMFNAFNGQYIKISIGKGLVDINTLRKRISRYVNFFQ